jgi:DNA-binding CsgD family transcriptional regulator
VLGRLSPPERERLSLQAVDALTADHDALRGERLALAANLCARSGFSARAAELLLLVERENIAAGALAAAEDGLREAARLAADGSAVVGEIAVERLRVLALGARTDEALAIGDEMIPAVGVAARRRLALQLTRACVAAERWSQAQHYLDVAAAAAQSGTVGADPEPLALAAHIALGLHERDEALRLAAAAVDAGERTDRPEVVCEALEVTGRALRRADPPASRAAFAAGERLAARRGLVPWRIRALAELGTHDILAGEGIGRLEQARLLALECGMLGTATGLDLQIAAGTTSSAGHVAALLYARRCAEQSARLHLPGPRAHALMFVARGLFWAGATAESDAVLEESARTVANPMNALTTRDAHRGYACWLAHDEEGGVAGLGAGVAHLRASAVSNPAPVWGHWALLATVVHPRDDGPLTELRHSDLLVQGSIRAAVHYADAVVATRAGRLEAARSLLAEGDAAVAGKAHERLFLRCLLVGTNAAAAPFEAEPLLREALTLWEPAGEVRLARWCRERLRMLGHPVPRPERDRTAVPARLRAVGVTGRELEVLRLVAGGSSNAEVAARLHLSRRTVETHVSHLLAKTGVAGRAALAEWLPS